MESYLALILFSKSIQFLLVTTTQSIFYYVIVHLLHQRQPEKDINYSNHNEEQNENHQSNGESVFELTVERSFEIADKGSECWLEINCTQPS